LFYFERYDLKVLGVLGGGFYKGVCEKVVQVIRNHPFKKGGEGKVALNLS